METSQLICVANWLTGSFVVREMQRFCLISGCTGFCWGHIFSSVLGKLRMNLRRLCF